ncbi:unnamed protein product [Caenorhabditis nigoni]
MGMIFATLEVIFFPNMHSFNSATFYFTLSRPFGLSTNMLSTSLVIYTGFYSATICLIAIQFMYRYWAVFDENKLVFFEGWRSLIWVAYVLYFGAQWAIGAYNFVKTDEVARNYFREEMLLRYNVSVDDLPSLAMVAFDPKSGDIRWWNLMTVVNMSFIMTIQYAIMIHCGYSMFAKMEEKLQNFSSAHRNHHKQIFKTLMLQITVPSIFLFIPLSFIIYIPLLELQLSLPTGVLLSGFSLYPAADSIMVIEEMMSRYNANVDDLPILASVAFDPTTGDVRWRNVRTILNMSLIMNIQYAIMIQCGYSMFVKMEEKLQNFSTSHRNHHKQLFKTLMLQITVPSIFLFTPLSFIIYFPLFEIELSLPTGVLLSGFSLYPAVDSIMVMCIVAEYRDRLKKILLGLRKSVCLCKTNRVEQHGNQTAESL